jgi:hypothetical protein
MTKKFKIAFCIWNHTKNVLGLLSKKDFHLLLNLKMIVVLNIV